MRFTQSLSLFVLALIVTFVLAGSALARMGTSPDQPAQIRSMHVLVDHYRDLTWTYERAGDLPRARELFLRIRRYDAGFADVAERLAALG